MDRFWQWAWDRHGARYSWACFAFTFAALLPVYLICSFIVVAYEKSDRYIEAAGLTVAAALLLAYVIVLPAHGGMRLVERFAAGHHTDRVTALESTYAYGRRAVTRTVGGGTVWAALLFAGVDAIAGGSPLRLAQYATLGAIMGATIQLIGVHTIIEGELRPARVALAGNTGIGDSLPRSQPTFAAWSNGSVLAVAFAFGVAGAMLAIVFARGKEDVPVLYIVIGGALTILVAGPLAVGTAYSPSLQPIRDLAEGTERVAAGDYTQRLPVVQDDDLGALAAAFNRMQAGLAERQRLQAAFGTYVDPALAARLLQQGDDVFNGERRQVTVMFVDIRDFTPFVEAHTAEDTVARLNALFEIVVPPSSRPAGTSTNSWATAPSPCSARPTISPTTPTPR